MSNVRHINPARDRGAADAFARDYETAHQKAAWERVKIDRRRIAVGQIIETMDLGGPLRPIRVAVMRWALNRYFAHNSGPVG